MCFRHRLSVHHAGAAPPSAVDELWDAKRLTRSLTRQHAMNEEPFKRGLSELCDEIAALRVEISYLRTALSRLRPDVGESQKPPRPPTPKRTSWYRRPSLSLLSDCFGFRSANSARIFTGRAPTGIQRKST